MLAVLVDRRQADIGGTGRTVAADNWRARVRQTHSQVAVLGHPAQVGPWPLTHQKQVFDTAHACGLFVWPPWLGAIRSSSFTIRKRGFFWFPSGSDGLVVFDSPRGSIMEPPFNEWWSAQLSNGQGPGRA